MVRLNKYLAECGVGSRRKCDQFILESKVTVNGQIETRLGTKIDENVDSIKVNGRSVKPVKRFDYYILNKPEGVVTTVSDEKGRKTVLDLIKTKKRLFPVGRLDIDSTGLLLLTNDGALAYTLTHPKFEVDKIYSVRLDRPLKDKDKKELESGVELAEGTTSACTIEFPNHENKKRVRITLHQGWKRQLRRMFAMLGYEVLELRRIGFACLSLRGLKGGAYRRMTSTEVERLKSIS